MKRLLIVSFVLTIALLALTVGAMALGTRLSQAPAVLRPSCALPCWNGIRPGDMTIDVANQILFSQGYEPQNLGGSRMVYVPGKEDRRRCTVRLTHHDGTVIEMRLSNCPTLSLGDVLAVWGKPSGLMYEGMTLDFQRGLVRVGLHAQCTGDLSPYATVHTIRFTHAPDRLPNAITWRGFSWHYQYFAMADC